MIAWQTARRQVAIAGWVTDGQNGKPVEGAAVTLEGVLPPLRKTTTRPDGMFYFLDLRNGEYTLAASAPGWGGRYGLSQSTATVSRDAAGKIKIAYVKLLLRPTMIQGKVTAANRDNGVGMAEIRVKGSGERAFSDARGQYVLTGIEPGKRTILVTARDYPLISEIVTLERGASKDLSFVLGEQAQPRGRTVRTRQ